MTIRRLGGLVLVAYSLCFVALMRPLSAEPSSQHQRELTAAWEAYAKRKFDVALSHVDIVIREFRLQAARDQKKLSDAKTQVPIGRVTREQMNEVHANGLLNDVAGAYYVRGRCEDKLGRKDAATKAMIEASKFPSARCWDEKGKFFWSPAEAAQRFMTNPDLADKSSHEAYTAEAWKHFNRGDYEKAMVVARRCIEEFKSSAVEMQETLEMRKVSLPIGKVSEQTKKTIDSNGVLNDTAACHYILGRSAENRNDKETAAATYREGSKLTLGRCWDSEGWFWSPAQKCEDRLQELQQ